MSRLVQAASILLGVAIALEGASLPARAQNPETLVGGTSLALVRSPIPGRSSAKVTFKRDPTLYTLANPTCAESPEGAYLHWSSDLEVGPEVNLPCANWRVAGAGFRYTDRSGAHGGVTTVTHGPGRLSVTARGASYAPALAGPVSHVEVTYRAGSRHVCGRFTDFRRNDASRVMGKGPTTACALACDDGFAEGHGFDFWIIQQGGTVREWLETEGARRLDNVEPNGATRKNALWETHTPGTDSVVPELAIESQRVGASLIAGGLAQVVMHPGESVYTGDGSMLDLGLKAIEWGLDQRSKTSTAGFSCNDTSPSADPTNVTPNSWPCERGGDKKGGHSIHPKSTFIESAASALQMIRDAAPLLPPSYAVRVDGPGGAAEELAAVGGWLNGQGTQPGDVWDYRKLITIGSGGYMPSKANFNQLLFVPVALFKIGALVGNPTFIATARDWMENPTYGVLKEEAIVAGSSPPQSILPENSFAGLGGFDASYQTVSIDLLVDWAAWLPPADAFRRDRLLPTLERAYRRFDASLVRPAGSTWQVDGSHESNTRTCECGARSPGAGELVIPIRMYRYGLLAGTLTCDGIATKAGEVQLTGQTLEHYQDCSSAGVADGDLCVDPF